MLQPLVVQVNDATTGNPVGAGVSVNWQGNSFTGAFLSSGTGQTTTVTDATGTATAYYALQPNPFVTNILSPFIQSTVIATAGGNTATFTLTQLATQPTSAVFPYIIVVPVNIPVGTTLTGAVGTTVTPPIQIQVGASNGLAVTTLPNVAVQLLNFQDPAKGPLVSCVGSATSGAGINTVFTDANGNATCTPIFGGQPGNGRFIVTVGGIQTATLSPVGFWQALPDPNDPGTLPQVNTGWQNSIPINMNVTPGAPGTIKIVSPSGGTAAVTAPTAVSLTVEADTTAGTTAAGSTVNWKVVSPASGVTLSTSTTTSGTNGQSTNNVNIGSSVSGTVQITASLASDATKSVTFKITVSPPVTVSQFQIISGNNQTALVNTQFPLPLVVKLTTGQGSPAGIPVQFAALNGSLGLSANTVNTDANGLAQVIVTAGPNPGPASVVATVPSFIATGSVSFLLTVVASAPQITAANFVNGADGNANSLSPCSLGALVTTPGAVQLPTVSPSFPGGTVVTSAIQLSFGSLPAPILNIGNNGSGQQQVLFQVPCDVTPGSAVPVALSVGGATSTVNLNIQAASPGVFQTQMSDGTFRAVLVRPDGSFVSLQNPARLGEIVVSYVTGLGATTPSVSTHSLPAPTGSATAAANDAVAGTVVPGINAGGANLIYAKLSEDLPGVYLVAFQIPSNSPTGNDVPYSISLVPVGSTTPISSAASKIPVHQ